MSWMEHKAPFPYLALHSCTGDANSNFIMPCLNTIYQVSWLNFSVPLASFQTKGALERLISLL